MLRKQPRRRPNEASRPKGDRRERSDDRERRAMRPRRVPASFAGRMDGAQERIVTFALDGRRQTTPHPNSLEVHCDADAVRSVPRV